MRYIPIKIRRYWGLIASALVVIVGIIVFLGPVRVIPYTVSASTHAADINQLNETLLLLQEYADSMDVIFDDTYVHEIAISIDPEDLEQMVATYLKTTEKDYFPANVEIDGIPFANVGLRLKGNSTLGASVGNSEDLPGVSLMEGLSIPYLIKLDEYEDGQNYLGHTQFSLRNSFKDDAVMHETLGYAFFDQLGVEAPSAVYTTVSINDEAEELYVLAEIIDESFVERHFLEADGQIGDLFKEVDRVGDFAYRGEDLTHYQNYELITNKNESDQSDLIEFLYWIEQASDEQFESELEQYIDVQSLLSYLAFCEVLVSLDSLPGSNTNFYLYQYPTSGQFVVVPWDLNETFGGFGMNGHLAYEMGLFYDVESASMGEEGMMMPGMDGQMMQPPEGGYMLPPEDGQMMQPPMHGQGHGRRRPKKLMRADGTQAQIQLIQNIQPFGDRDMKEPHKMMEGSVVMPGVDHELEQPVLVQRLFESDLLTTRYLEVVQEFTELLLDEEILKSEAEKTKTLLFEANQEREFWSEEDWGVFERGVLQLIEFAKLRQEFLFDELAKM